MNLGDEALIIGAIKIGKRIKKYTGDDQWKKDFNKHLYNRLFSSDKEFMKLEKLVEKVEKMFKNQHSP